MSQVSSCPVTMTFVPAQPPAGLAHRRVGFGQDLVERGLERAGIALLGLAQLIGESGPLLGIGAVVLLLLQTLHVRGERPGALGDDPPQLGGLGLELAVALVLETRLVTVNRVHQRADALHLPLESRAEHLRKQPFDHRSSV